MGVREQARSIGGSERARGDPGGVPSEPESLLERSWALPGGDRGAPSDKSRPRRAPEGPEEAIRVDSGTPEPPKS